MERHSLKNVSKQLNPQFQDGRATNGPIRLQNRLNRNRPILKKQKILFSPAVTTNNQSPNQVL